MANLGNMENAERHDKKVKKVDQIMGKQGVDPKLVDTKQKENIAKDLPDSSIT